MKKNKKSTVVRSKLVAQAYEAAKSRAADAKITFGLSLADFRRVVTRPCQYCRIEPGRGIHAVDRTRPRFGYSISNVVPSCARCASMKGDMTAPEFIDHVQGVATRSDGDDYATRTTYVSEENTGDTLKVVLLCVYDLCDKFNLQKAEIKAVIAALVDEHIVETDLLDENPDFYEDRKREQAAMGKRVRRR